MLNVKLLSILSVKNLSRINDPPFCFSLCFWRMFVLLPSAWGELPRDSLRKNTSSCHPRQGGRGEGGSENAGIADWLLVITNIHAGAASVPRCQVAPQLWCSIQSHSSGPAAGGRCSHPEQQLEKRCPALTSAGACRAKHLACPSRASGTLASPPWAHRKCILRRKRLCWNSLQPFAKQREARGSLPGLSTFATAHEVKFGLPKQTVKQMGCYVHLLYLWLCIIMITGWLPWTVQAVKGGQLCFYNIVSHKANTEIPNCLIFYLKKLYRHKAEECWKRKTRKEVCINKEVFLTSKMSQESQSLQKLG